MHPRLNTHAYILYMPVAVCTILLACLLAALLLLLLLLGSCCRNMILLQAV
jgi:hypothetical protein